MRVGARAGSIVATVAGPPRGTTNSKAKKGMDRMDTRTLNHAYFGQGITLADIEKLTLSAADLDRLTLGKADLADLAPPPLNLPIISGRCESSHG
jgi:hypothetical protein